MTKIPCRPHLSRRSMGSPLLGASIALLLAACDGGPVETGYTDPLILGEIGIQLTRAETCDDLLTGIQEGAVAQLQKRLERIREAGQDGYYDGEYDYDLNGAGPIAVSQGTAGNGVRNTAVALDGAPSPTVELEPASAFEEATPRDDSGNNSTDSVQEEGEALGAGDVNGGFSGTTVQVVDVDEADFVKTDGDRMYVLHGGTLLAVNAWPATESEIVASALVEGEPTEMFVYEGKAVVFSRIYQNLSALAEGSENDESRYYGDYTGYTKITVLDVSGGEDSPGVVRESYIEGNYTSSRRHDGLVRAVIQDGYKVPSLGRPNVEFRDPFGNPYSEADIDGQLNAWADRMTRSIRATELGDWLPREFEAENGEISPVPFRCADYYKPDTGLTESGVTSVVALDLNDLEASLGGATILGRAERVYSNKNALVISQTDYRYQFDEDMSPEQTVLHRFDLDGPQTGYTASGTVAGRIHNQFSMDERNGIIRVSTTEERWDDQFEGNTVLTPSISVDPTTGGVGAGGASSSGDNANPAPPAMEEVEEAEADELLVEGRPFVPQPPPENGPINRVVTLAVEGNELVPHGSTEQFGATERIYATRFMGDRAYVVTFRRTDPLFVVDMSDDAEPKVVGELKIPGFSDYLYPLGENHLFAIGRDASEEGRVRGLALQIFDVSDPTAPNLAHRHVYEDSSSSPANVDHRAITFHNDGSTVAFPFQDYRTNTQTLELFDVSAESGITRLGGMDPAQDISLEECLTSIGYGEGDIAELQQDIEASPEWQEELFWQCNYNQRFRRAVFRENFVYGVGTSGLYTYDLDALDAGPVSSLTFPGEVYNYGMYSGEGVSTPGSAPSIGIPRQGDPIPAATQGPDVEPEEEVEDAADNEASVDTETDTASSEEEESTDGEEPAAGE